FSVDQEWVDVTGYGSFPMLRGAKTLQYIHVTACIGKQQLGRQFCCFIHEVERSARGAQVIGVGGAGGFSTDEDVTCPGGGEGLRQIGKIDMGGEAIAVYQ